MSAIDDYLSDLAAALRVSPQRRERVLAEARDHVEEAATRLEVGGVPRADAEREAIARFGDARLVAGRFGREHSLRQFAFELYAHGVLLIGVGLLVVGLSGALSAPLGWLAGHDFISGARSDLRVPLAQCPELAEYHPGSPDCAAAWSTHFFQEHVLYRSLGGVVGFVLVASHSLLLRRVDSSAGRARRWAVAAGVTAATAFGAATLGLTGLAIRARFGETELPAGFAIEYMVSRYAGEGLWLSSALASLLGLVAALLFVSRMRSRSNDATTAD